MPLAMFFSKLYSHLLCLFSAECFRFLLLPRDEFSNSASPLLSDILIQGSLSSSEYEKFFCISSDESAKLTPAGEDEALFRHFSSP